MHVGSVRRWEGFVGGCRGGGESEEGGGQEVRPVSGAYDGALLLKLLTAYVCEGVHLCVCVRMFVSVCVCACVDFVCRVGWMSMRCTHACAK